MDPATAIAITSVAAGAYGTKKSMDEQKKAHKAQEVARKAQQRMQDVRAKKERTNMIREARIKRAALLQAGQNAGVGTTSSPVLGATGSLQSQLAGNMAFSNQQQSLAQQGTDALGQAAQATQNANEWGAITQLAAGVGAQAGNFDFKGAATDAATNAAKRMKGMQVS